MPPAQLARTRALCAGCHRTAASSKRPTCVRCSLGGVRGANLRCGAAAVAEPEAPLDTAPVGVAETEQDAFEQLSIDSRLTVRLAEIGVHEPSDIQRAAMPHIVEGRTLAIQSYTGSGKTLAFLLPVLTLAVRRLEGRVYSKAARDNFGPEAILIAPSRELAMQTLRVAQRLLPKDAWPLVQQAIGGANMRRQIEAIKAARPLVVVGTPGRLAELSRSGVLRTHKTSTVVLDEVDQLLCHQFRDDLLRLLQHLGTKLDGGRARQIVAASATMSPSMVASLRALIGGDADVPIISPLDDVGVGSDAPRAASGAAASSSGAAALSPTWGWGHDVRFANRGVGGPTGRGTAGGLNTAGAVDASMPPALDHCYVVEPRRHHLDAVRRLVHALDAQHVLVFMNHQARLKDAMQKLAARGLSVGVLHGQMAKQQRHAVLEGFRSGKFRVVVTSDVVARGLDVAACDAVINLELPSSAAHYAHRAGRTGRMGRPGVVASIVEHSQAFVVQKLSKQLGVAVETCRVQGGLATIVSQQRVRTLGRHDERRAAAAATDEEGDAALVSAATTPDDDGAGAAAGAEEAAWRGAGAVSDDEAEIAATGGVDAEADEPRLGTSAALAPKGELAAVA